MEFFGFIKLFVFYSFIIFFILFLFAGGFFFPVLLPCFRINNRSLVTFILNDCLSIS